MSALVQTDKYGAVNTTYTTTMGYYVIKLISEAYALREETTCDRKIGSAGELVVKAQYIDCMKDNTKRYLYGKITTTKNIIVPTCKILHPCLDVMKLTEVENY